MKDDKLQTKRQAKKGFRMLHARMTKKKQRVSAAANPDVLDQDVPNVGVGRALTVILILHVIAIGAIYIGTQWNKGGDVVAEADTKAVASVDISKVNKALGHEWVQVGDTYEVFAARHQVDAGELKALNGNAQIYAGKKLALPARKIVSSDAMSDQKQLSAGAVSERPEIETPAGVAPPKAVLVKPMRNPNTVPRAIPVVEASGETYVVKGGDSVWRICNRYGIKEADLLKINRLSDPRKLREGMTLKIPAK